MRSGQPSKELLTRVASAASFGIVVIFMFQNCGKAGFQSANGGSAMSSALGVSSSADPRVSAAPFPYQANFNQISYMSCPAAGASATEPLDAMANPFYNVRAGSYDNSRFATNFGLSGVSETELSTRLVGGLGLTKEIVAHVDAAYRKPVDLKRQEAFNAVLQGSPYKTFQLAAGLINENNYRSTQEGQFGFSYDLMKGQLAGLGDPVVTTYLSKQRSLASGGTAKQSFFGNLELGSRSMGATFAFGQSELDQGTFSSELRGSLILALGYTKTDANSEITQFLSPLGEDDKSLQKSLYGRGYKMEFRYEWPGSGGVVMPVTMMTNVEEYDLTMTDLQKANLSVSEGQQWDCFALRIVRHEDRIDPITKRPYVNPGVHSLVTANNQQIKGVKVACPVQDVAEADFQDPNTGAIIKRGINNELNNIRLQMARRFLPAEMWEVNTDPDYLCAVPNDLALGKGKCYASGDKDYSRYIQYDHNMGGTKPCGTGGNECPAYVSICYRKR